MPESFTRAQQLHVPPLARPSRTLDPEVGRHGARHRAAPGNRDRLDPYLIAVRTFTTTYDGQAVEIVAGQDYVIASHPIVKRHPHAFAPTRGSS